MKTIQSNAKLNLFLHIIGRNEQNYHQIQSVMSFINLTDTITIRESNQKNIKFEYNNDAEFVEINEKNNSLIKIIENFETLINKKINLEILIKKNIPIGAGLAGGSGNAAALLKYLQQKYSTNLSQDEEKKIALSIGCDTLPCLYNKTLISENIGDKISSCDLDTELQQSHILIIYPQITSLSIKAYKIFKEENCKFSEKITIPEIINFDFLKNQKNDLTYPFKLQFPEVANLIKFIENIDINQNIIARMSGSGSAFFAICQNKTEIENINNTIKSNNEFCKYFTQICNFI